MEPLKNPMGVGKQKPMTAQDWLKSLTPEEIETVRDACNELLGDEAPPEMPTPDEVALTAMSGILASGKFGEDFGIAAEMAWKLCVPAYFAARSGFSDHMNKIYSTPEGEHFGDP